MVRQPEPQAVPTQALPQYRPDQERVEINLNAASEPTNINVLHPASRMPEPSTVEQFLQESKEYLRESASEESSESEISPMKSNAQSSLISASPEGSPLYANTTSNSKMSNRPMSNLAPLPQTVEEEKDDV